MTDEQKKIMENNIRIAEFMGWKLVEREYDYDEINLMLASDETIVWWDNEKEGRVYDGGDSSYLTLETDYSIPFSHDFNYLMQAVEKIRMTDGLEVSIKSNKRNCLCSIHKTEVLNAGLYGKGDNVKDAIYDAVCQYVNKKAKN